MVSLCIKVQARCGTNLISVAVNYATLSDTLPVDNRYGRNSAAQWKSRQEIL